MFVFFTTPTARRTDGQTDGASCTLGDMLRLVVRPSQDDWIVELPSCKFAMDDACSQTTGSTPFFLHLGEHPRSPINLDAVCKLPAAQPDLEEMEGCVPDPSPAVDYLEWPGAHAVT